MSLAGWNWVWYNLGIRAVVPILPALFGFVLTADMSAMTVGDRSIPYVQKSSHWCRFSPQGQSQVVNKIESLDRDTPQVVASRAIDNMLISFERNCTTNSKPRGMNLETRRLTALSSTNWVAIWVSKTTLAVCLGNSWCTVILLALRCMRIPSANLQAYPSAVEAWS